MEPYTLRAMWTLGKAGELDFTLCAALGVLEP